MAALSCDRSIPRRTADSCEARCRRLRTPSETRRGAVCLALSGAVTSFDSLDAVFKRFSQDALADGPEHESERPSFEVLALAYHHGVQVCRPVGTASERIDVPRAVSPDVRVGRCHDDAVGIGPVVVQTLPYAARALRDVRVRGTAVMHFEVLVGAVAKQRRAARPEVGEPGNELLRRRGRVLMEVD